MSSNALREGFREVSRDPVLLLIEVGWRWSFGAIATFVCALSSILLLGGIAVDPQRLRLLAALQPLQLAQTIAMAVAGLGVALLRAGILASLILSVCWIVLSALGRYATLSRPALAPGASLRRCFAISAGRALATLAALFSWIAASLFAGFVAGVSSRGREMNLPLVSIILVPALLVIVSGWSAINWYLSLAPLFPDRGSNRLLVGGRRCFRFFRNELLEVSIVTAVIRAALFIAALMLSVAASAVITSPRVLLADLLAVTLLYFVIADFLYVVRLAAYSKLAREAVLQPSSAMLDASTAVPGRSQAPGTQAGAPVPQ